MAEDAELEKRIARLAREARDAPSGRRRYRSTTFWDRLGYTVRTAARVRTIQEALSREGVTILDDGAFGKERPDDWVTLAPDRPAAVRAAADPAGFRYALSVRQPWAELIVRGIKDVENRSWRTHHRGPLLIHAGRGAYVEDFEEVRDVHGVALDPDRLEFGALIGVVDVVDCTLEARSTWHDEGMWGWYLERPRRLRSPIPYKGAVGLLRVPEELVRGALS